MQAVGRCIVKILRMLIKHRVESADTVQVDYRNSPYVSGFLYHVYIFVYVEAQLVGKRFFRLNVVVAEAGLCTVYRCQQDDLFGREVLLQVT